MLAAFAAPAGLQQHPLSAAFPAMNTEDFDALRDSVTNDGVLNPIAIFEGMIIDGWHRYCVAVELGYECPAVELAEGIDPRDFVLAQNKARRHVTQAQLAMAVTAVYAWRPAAGGRPAEKPHTECEVSKTNAELAEIAGVHPNTIGQAKAVQTSAAPAVVEAVKRGDIGLPKAAAIAKLPAEQQAAAIRAPAPKAPKPAQQPAPKRSSTAPAADDPQAKVDELSARLAEMAGDLEDVMTENAAMRQVFDADDRLAAAQQALKDVPSGALANWSPALPA
ncbi:MAG: hypothetical protein QM586_04925 [Xenophilus sp.]